MKKDKRLLKLFREYNKAFFDNQLEEPDILQYKKMKDAAGQSLMESQGPTAVYIHSGLRGFYRLTQIVMIHEMAHLSVGIITYRPHHGTRWQAKIDSLYQMGAYEGIL